jgi:hypothetical protein
MKFQLDRRNEFFYPIDPSWGAKSTFFENFKKIPKPPTWRHLNWYSDYNACG